MDTIDAETTAGTVRGELRDGVTAFKGIPYAEPPFGANAFKPPVPRAPWEGVRECTAYGPGCPQPSSPIFGGLSTGEDFLSVNVWAPEGATGLPVMFWIHGGGFLMGSNAGSGSDGTPFARDGAVFVSCNYRLGAFGFLHAGHLDDAYAAGSGAYGVADQIAALRWTRENIAAFGGDPDNITIFGSSAGGTFVGELLGCPSAQGLFQQAVCQSAAAAPLFGFPAHYAEAIAEAMLDKLGVPARDLHTVDPAGILQAQTEFMEEKQRGEHPESGRMIPFVPLTGGDLLPQPPYQAITDGVGTDVSLVIGTNRDECTLYALMEEMGAAETGMSPGGWDADPAVQQAILDVYERSQESGSAITPQVSMDTDRAFRVPALRIADAHHRAGGTTRVYQFAWRSPAFNGRVGASHGIEGPFVFDDFSLPITKTLIGDEMPQDLLTAMHGSWISFAATGNPSAAGVIPVWPTHNPDSRPTMVFDTKPLVTEDPDGERRASWDEIDLSL
ncbi:MULTISPECIES: carboxylesterase family protein [unclassified Streptomyces]|uniref:carboxylesterase/lipase family protein n=1 Tax=unclassified Streptomyces TaxID=2593676 RepID=UPI002E1766A0|nr:MULTISPECIES: carboxylesterase family protein [unclassified Streptomyces]